MPDSSGRIVLHYRVNATNPPPANSSLTAQQVQQAIDAAAQAWMGGDPRVVFIDDGLTTDQPGFNEVVGFAAEPAVWGQADIDPTCSTCDTYSLWDIKLAVSASWVWNPCDPAHGNPCSNVPGNEPDLESVATHEFGHVLGLGHSPHPQDEYLTMFGGGDASATRELDTLGLGDVLGERALYPTSAPMPTIYDP